MLIRKIVLNRKEVSPEMSIEDYIKEMGRNFGEKLWMANVEIRKDNTFKFCDVSDEDNPDENQREKHIKWCYRAIDIIKGSGRVMTFNNERINNEEEIDVDIDIESISKLYNEDKRQLNENDLLSYYFITNAADFYQKSELGKIDKRRINEYNRWIRNIFRSTGIKFISFKIVKLGGKDYSLYTIN